MNSAAVLGVLVVGMSILYAVVGVFVFRWVNHGRVREGHNDVLAPLFATAGVIYAVLLAFVVIVVFTAYDDAHQNISDETTQLSTLYRLTAGMKYFTERDYMRKQIREYTHWVIDEEWKTQQQDGKASPNARASVGLMYQYYHIMPYAQSSSNINGEFLRTLANITHERNRRLLQATESLPTVMWLGLILGGAVVIFMACILYMETRWAHVLMVSVLSALIGTLLFVTMVLDKPFVGPMALTSESFESNFNLYDSVDAGR